MNDVNGKKKEHLLKKTKVNKIETRMDNHPYVLTRVT
jgi:hypothetical protein